MTADLEALNAPGKGFLWHLRRNLDATNAIPGGLGTTGVGGDRGLDGGGGDREISKGVLDEKRRGTGVVGGDEAAEGVARSNEPTCDRSVVVLPPYGAGEVSGYTGGYTVRRHGRPEKRGEEAPGAVSRWHREGEYSFAVAVDAVQLEFGSQFRRTPEARAVVAEAVAAAIFSHLWQGAAK